MKILYKYKCANCNTDVEKEMYEDKWLSSKSRLHFCSVKCQRLNQIKEARKNVDRNNKEQFKSNLGKHHSEEHKLRIKSIMLEKYNSDGKLNKLVSERVLATKYKNIKYFDVNYKCDSCGKEYSERLGECNYKRFLAMDKHFCSQECHMNGSGNINWKGGITPDMKAVRKSLEYKEWRKKVFNRDDHTCQDCGAKGVYLYAHHIVAFAALVEDAVKLYSSLSIYDACINYMKLWDIGNGKTLCGKCHKKIHKSIKVPQFQSMGR